MKAVINEKGTHDGKQYPWLGRIIVEQRETIILFYDKNKGICMSTVENTGNKIGEIG